MPDEAVEVVVPVLVLDDVELPEVDFEEVEDELEEVEDELEEVDTP